MNNYYGANEKGMTTHLNISNIDPNISTLDRSQIKAQTRVVPQQPITPQPTQDPKEARELQESKIKQKNSQNPALSQTPAQPQIPTQSKTPSFSQNLDQPKTGVISRSVPQATAVQVPTQVAKQEPKPTASEIKADKKEESKASIDPSHQKNTSSLFSIKFKGVGISFDYKQDLYCNQTAFEDDALNNEWEKILNEVEEQVAREAKTGAKQQINKKEIVDTARK